MTLKEKFRQELTGHLSDEKTEVDVNIATRIAEEFAIGFAEWVLNESTKKGFYRLEEDTYRYNYRSPYSKEELLEIYKKEKGL